MAEQPAPSAKPKPPPAAPSAPDGRASLCVFTNRAMPFKTLLAYCTKFYPESWLAERQQKGVPLPHPYVLQYEIIIRPSDWETIRVELKNALGHLEVPTQYFGGDKDTVWLRCRQGYAIRTLKRTVGWRRRGQRYFNHAKQWRGFVWGLCCAPIFWLWLYWLFYR